MSTPSKSIRCAIYTRKSTEEGLDSEFNTLDAQREAAESYIASQRHEGWVCLPEKYDDGGFTGGNMERPALQRLLAEIEAGRVDCIVVYKVDRLSRSLLDFARLMEILDRHGVSFVSVTQQFNTTNSMGRLTLNILLSFAQFEREIIAERIRDKVHAARRKGKWTGGTPVLGYDIDYDARKLVINPEEAAVVRRIFDIYLEQGSLLPAVQVLKKRKIRCKQWKTKKGEMRGGGAFNKNNLHLLLTNPLYIGQVRCGDETFPGEHEGIIEQELWCKVRDQLKDNRHRGSVMRNKQGALLRGIIRCAHCDAAMVHTYSGTRTRYRYYVCSSAQKHGWDTCPSKSLPAQQIEDFIVGRVRALGTDGEFLEQTMAEFRRMEVEGRASLEREYRELAVAHRHWRDTLAKLDKDNPDCADLRAKLLGHEERMDVLQKEMKRLDAEQIPEDKLIATLTDFDAVWDAMLPAERERVLRLLIERVDYYGDDGTVTVHFRRSGFRSLAVQERIAG